jgi:hypothetical protein
MSYVYDHVLTFGAQHLIQGEQVKAVFQIPKEAKQKFEYIFSAVRATDPEPFGPSSRPLLEANPSSARNLFHQR